MADSLTVHGRSSKQLSPPDLAAKQGQNWGMGVRHALFPGLALGAKLAASFPTPFSTASGVASLIAGPTRALRPLDY
jgi:hypothetical protein